MERFLIFITVFLCFIALTSFFIHLSLIYFGFFKIGIQSKVLTLSMIILPLVVFITMTVGNIFWSKINSTIYTVSALYLAIGALLFIAVILAWVFWGLNNGFDLGLTRKMIINPIMIFVLLAFIWGIIEAISPRIMKYEVNSDNLSPLWAQKRLIFFADSHFGMAGNERFAKKIVNMIEKEAPDAVFIAGDLIDGPKFPYEKTLRHFEQLNPSIGIFYTAGNHEEYNSEQNKFYEAIPKNFTILNEKSIVANGTEIVGLIYKKDSKEETLARFKNLRKNENLPTITILHDPKNAQILAENNSDLTLSGHTHGGQFYPFAFGVRAIYGPLTRGVNYFKEGATATTVGVGTAGPMFRLGVRPELVILEIK